MKPICPFNSNSSMSFCLGCEDFKKNCKGNKTHRFIYRINLFGKELTIPEITLRTINKGEGGDIEI